MTGAHDVATRSDQGGHPHGNEDSLWVGDGVWVVADGMGGHVGGEVASSTAVAALREVVDGAAAGLDAAALGGLLEEGIARAGADLRRRGEEDPDLATMGTTLVAAGLAGGGTASPELVVVNVGDSRAYLLSPEGRLERLTRDDNVAEEMVSLGLLDEAAAATHPGQYQLTKALTAYDEAAPRPTTTVAPARGRLLLCSDGLNGELGDATIEQLLRQGSPDDAAAALLEAALRAPARDNVTVVVVDL